MSNADNNQWSVTYTWDSKEKMNDNARLFNVAPDMYRALLSITNYPDAEKYLGSIIFNKAKAALAKAGGEQDYV